MDEMKNILKWAGFNIDGNKCFVPDVSELEIINILAKVNTKLETEEELALIDSNEVPFEEVIFNDDIDNVKDTLTEEGPKMVKKLGVLSSDERGLSNSISLALFLVIDVVAIFVGLFLLMH